MKKAAKLFIVIGIILGFPLILPLIVGIIALNRLKKATCKDDIKLIAILTLFLCNIIGGILMLCLKDEDFTSSEEQGVAKTNESKGTDPKVKLDKTLRNAIDQYNDAYTMMNDNGVTLYRERTRAVDMITHIEDLVNSIANRPKSFNAEMAVIKTNKEQFISTCDFAQQELEMARKSALGVGAGVATGAAIVSVAPSVAMWVATTFGTASTGTAISTLSGAAAANAALAWLGGGALAAGGGGIAAGNALLALAGPVGWGLAGVSILSSVVLFSIDKMKRNKKKKEEIESLKSNTHSARMITAQIQVLLDEVVALRDNLGQQYNECITYFGDDFTTIPTEKQIQLGVLVNNTKSLAATLSKTIEQGI